MTRIMYTHDDRFIVTAGMDGSVRVWTHVFKLVCCHELQRGVSVKLEGESVMPSSLLSLRPDAVHPCHAQLQALQLHPDGQVPPACMEVWCGDRSGHQPRLGVVHPLRLSLPLC